MKLGLILKLVGGLAGGDSVAFGTGRACLSVGVLQTGTEGEK